MRAKHRTFEKKDRCYIKISTILQIFCSWQETFKQAKKLRLGWNFLPQKVENSNHV